jgi:hypothetical protein
MNPIVKKLKEIEVILNEDKLAQLGADYMRSITPIRSRNARNKTDARGSTIYASYPYAKRLDEGWSKQNQIGLIDPTIAYLEKYIKTGIK